MNTVLKHHYGTGNLSLAKIRKAVRSVGKTPRKNSSNPDNSSSDSAKSDEKSKSSS